MMRSMLHTLLHDYEWIHLGLGLSGNFMFFVGSVLFLPTFEPYKTFGVWLFIVGSFFMLVGAAGNFAKQVWTVEHPGEKW